MKIFAALTIAAVNGEQVLDRGRRNRRRVYR